MEKQFASVLWADGHMMAMPMHRKGVRLFAGAVEDIRFFSPDQSDVDRVFALRECLSKARPLGPDDTPNDGAGQDWPTDIVMFAKHVGCTPKDLDKILQKVSGMLEGDVVTFTYTKRARGKLAFDGLPPNTQQKLSIRAPDEDIAAAMKPFSSASA